MPEQATDSTPLQQRELDPRLRAWVDEVDRCWRRAAVARATRDQLRHELLLDLGASLGSGASVESLVQVEAGRFAADVARAAGVRASTPPVRPLTVDALVGASLEGAGLGFLAALATVYPVGLHLVDAARLGDPVEGWAVLAMHVLAGAFALAGSAVGVGWWFRSRPDARATAAVASGLLAAGGLASIAPAMALAGAAGYSSSSAVVLLEVGLVGGCCAGAAWLAGLLLTGGVAPSERSAP